MNRTHEEELRRAIDGGRPYEAADLYMKVCDETGAVCVATYAKRVFDAARANEQKTTN